MWSAVQEFLMEFGINWHPAILQSSPGRRGEILTWKWKQFTVCEVMEGWLAGCQWPDCVCFDDTGELCCPNHCVIIDLPAPVCPAVQQSLLCYKQFVLDLNTPPGSLSGLFINIKPHQSWKETEILYKLYLLDDKSTASLTFATQNIRGNLLAESLNLNWNWNDELEEEEGLI